MSIEIDLTNMVSIEGQDAQFKDAFAGVEKLRASGEIGFIDVVFDASWVDPIIQFAKNVDQDIDDIVVLGIGGSALGPIALRTALFDWKNQYSLSRLRVLDNIDPVTMSLLLDDIDLHYTLFVVTSKSGGTAETMSQYLIINDFLRKKDLDPREHLVFVTDPEKGALRQIANKDSIPVFDIPSNVGGRFSVLTAVGMLPAALINIDVKELLRGARDMAERCRTSNLKENPAGMFAVSQWSAHEKHGKNIHVLMPYVDRLKDLSSWFVQLWAESLGKNDRGPTPLAALGATDQHSQLQLFMEGTADKTVTFVTVKDRGTDITIPKAFREIDELSYLGGHALGELIDAEQKATAQALAKRGRPNMTIQMDKLDPWHVGGLIMLLEIATAYAGQLYSVNAFDQPGVELGKKIAYALLGRPGFTTLNT